MVNFLLHVFFSRLFCLRLTKTKNRSSSDRVGGETQLKISHHFFFFFFPIFESFELGMNWGVFYFHIFSSFREKKMVVARDVSRAFSRKSKN